MSCTLVPEEVFYIKGKVHENTIFQVQARQRKFICYMSCTFPYLAKLRKCQFWSSGTSAKFKGEWKKFLQSSVKVMSSPCFCEYVTHEVFKELIKLEYPLKDTSDHSTAHPLTHMEKSALRYVAGYVCRKVRDNLKKSNCKVSNKDSMIQCLAVQQMKTVMRTRLIDRGGLWQMNNDVFSLFVVMEE